MAATEETTSLIDEFTRLRVSSVLNKETTQYGKQYLTDGRDDTCWNSDQGQVQWVLVQFSSQATVGRISLQFQGGFSAQSVNVVFLRQEKESNVRLFEETIYPVDNNCLQTFPVKGIESNSLKLIFTDCTDFFGRLIVYKLDIFGTKS